MSLTFTLVNYLKRSQVQQLHLNTPFCCDISNEYRGTYLWMGNNQQKHGTESSP